MQLGKAPVLLPRGMIEEATQIFIGFDPVHSRKVTFRNFTSAGQTGVCTSVPTSFSGLSLSPFQEHPLFSVNLSDGGQEQANNRNSSASKSLKKRTSLPLVLLPKRSLAH